MSKSKSSTARYAATVIMSYLLSLFLLLLISSAVLLATLFSPGHMARRMTSSGFPDIAAAELRETIISHSSESGIPEEVIFSVPLNANIEGAMAAQILAAYGSDGQFDFSAYEDEVYDALLAYALSQGYEETAELDEGLRHLAEICAADLRALVSSPIIETLGGAARDLGRYVTALAIASAALAPATGALMRLSARRASRWLSSLIWALGAAAIGCALVPLAVLGTGFARRINITPPSYAALFSEWIEGVAHGYLVAMLPVIAALGACLTVWIVRQQRRRRVRRIQAENLERFSAEERRDSIWSKT